MPTPTGGSATAAFWQIVGVGAAPEASELADALDELSEPDENGHVRNRLFRLSRRDIRWYGSQLSPDDMLCLLRGFGLVPQRVHLIERRLSKRAAPSRTGRLK